MTNPQPSKCPNCDFGRRGCPSPAMCQWPDDLMAGMDEIDTLGALTIFILWVSMVALIITLGFVISDFVL